MITFGKSWMLERYYALSDNPMPLIYRQLDKAYPGSKFILTVRDDRGWVKSVERLWDPRYNPSRWEWDRWPISNRIHRALYGRVDFDTETFLARYRLHNADVREYFRDRPDDLLVMNLDQPKGWEELCRFLGCAAVPKEPYPHENNTHKGQR